MTKPDSPIIISACRTCASRASSTSLRLATDHEPRRRAERPATWSNAATARRAARSHAAQRAANSPATQRAGEVLGAPHGTHRDRRKAGRRPLDRP